MSNEYAQADAIEGRVFQVWGDLMKNGKNLAIAVFFAFVAHVVTNSSARTELVDWGSKIHWTQIDWSGMTANTWTAIEHAMNTFDQANPLPPTY